MIIGGVTTRCIKAAAAAVLAGVVLLATPSKAHAQQFAVGVQFGQPAYGYANRPGPGYGEHLRWERERAEIARRDAWIRHEQWERHEAWDRGRDFNRGGGYVPYRDRHAWGFYGR